MNHHSCRSNSDSIGNGTVMVNYYFENPIYQAEEYCELSEELARLLQQELKVIQLYQESLEIINLGSEDDKKEIIIGSALEVDVKKGLI